jgi:hypothetical protein
LESMDLRNLRYWAGRLDGLLDQALDLDDIVTRYRTLRLYALARQAVLTRWGEALGGAPETPTMHGLLWGTAWEDRSMSEWRCQPAAVPALGLPLRIALRLFRDALKTLADDAPDPSQGPTVWRLREKECVLNLLAWGRRLQLETDSPPVAPPRPIPDSEVSWLDLGGRDAWEIPPHPVFFLNRVLSCFLL